MHVNAQHPRDNRLAAASSVPNATDDLEEGEGLIPDELKLLLKQFRELGEYYSYLMAAKADSVKLSLRQMIVGVAFAAIGFVAVGGLIVIASWLLLSGTADGLGRLFGDRPWIGNLISGFLLLAAIGFGMYYAVARQGRIARERMAKKYENLQARQRMRFGRNVADWASATRPKK